MARLAGNAPADPIRAGRQFAAVAYLRWRLFHNGFGRKGATAELSASILMYTFLDGFVLLVIAGAGAAGYAAAARGHLALLAGIFWSVTLLQIAVSINIAAPNVSFDPAALIRFPLSFTRYLAIRLFLGLLSASTVVGTLALLAAATGVTVAIPQLGPAVFLAASTLALTNMLFLRMVFAWVDRWLSTRRAREVFTALLFVFFFTFQYLNVLFNGGDRMTPAQHARSAAILHLSHALMPFLAFFPPALASSAVLASSHGLTWLEGANLLSVLLEAGLFLAIFAWRMQREFHGENLSEAGARQSSPRPVLRAALRSVTSVPNSEASLTPPSRRMDRSVFPPTVLACLRKELLYVRRNTTQFYGLLAPLAMVFIFAARARSFGHQEYVFPLAMVYSHLGIAALSYNSLGLDGSGVQFYFFAPVPIHRVMLAKNIFGFVLSAAQITLLYALLSFTSGRPPLVVAAGTLCWVVLAALVNATIGNIRSINAPKKIDPGKLARRQASPLSALLSVGVILTLAATGYGVLVLAYMTAIPWLPVPVLLALALLALPIYLTGLRNLDTLALDHRETLIDALSKSSA